MQLNEEQLRFLKKEFGVSSDRIQRMEKAEWQEIREKCFDIEVEEAVAADFGEGEISDHGEIAASIASIKYSELTAG